MNDRDNLWYNEFMGKNKELYIWHVMNVHFCNFCYLDTSDFCYNLYSIYYWEVPATAVIIILLRAVENI